jgi:excisionase family DNA binding protein
MSQQPNFSRFTPDRLPDQRIFITVSEAASRLSCGITLIYEQINAGCYRSVKIGKKRLIDRVSLETFAASLTNQSGKGV